MSGEEWHWLLGAPSRPTFLYPSVQGVTLPQPFWCIREGDEIVTIGWSQSGLVQSILRGDQLSVLVEWLNGDLVIHFNGEATISPDPSRAQVWAQRLWTKFQGEGPMGYSPDRCDTVIRFIPFGGFQISTEQVSHQREGYREDSGTVLTSKLLHNLNQLLKEQRLPLVNSLEAIELIHFKDIDPITNKCGLLKVPSAKLVPPSRKGEFLRHLFGAGPSCPSWVNVMAFVEGGRPRLLRFNAQDPPLLSDSRFGGTMMMSLRSDLVIEFV
ncbi:hypothetical protein JST97_20335 [bacterium]|nr:hypothetical protein [bacterium]